MPTINLLPWREELRKQRQQNFAIATVAALALAALVAVGVNLYWNAKIAHQNERNARLEAEIAELDKQIEAIAGLERQRDRLIARMEIIEQLQRTRPESVYLFEQMVRILPDGVFFDNFTQDGRKLEFKGTAESSTRVSALMRNIESSPWLEDPGLEVVETSEEGGVRRSSFTVSARQVQQSEDEEPTP
jgi:type IV pilus assembly protein PilN